MTLTKIRRDEFRNHEASARAEAERATVVGVGNRIANAALAGAGKVEASEIDPFAQAAIALNADENRVAVEVLSEDVIGTDRGWDVVLAGDVAYERDMAAAVFAWLEGLARRGALVLVGDPRRTYLALDRLECVAEYSVPTTRALEDAEIKRAGVFTFRSAREIY